MPRFRLSFVSGFPLLYLNSHIPYVSPGAIEVSQVLDVSLLTCQALGPRQALGNLTGLQLLGRRLFSQFPSGFPTVPQYLDHGRSLRFLCVGFRFTDNVAAYFQRFDEAEIASG